MTPIVINSIGGQCPTQADATFYGCPVYFRARGGEWTIEICKPGGDPVCNPELFFMDGDDVTGGYMECDEVIRLLGVAFKRFTEKHQGPIYRGEDWPCR